MTAIQHPTSRRDKGAERDGTVVTAPAPIAAGAGLPRKPLVGRCRR